MSWLTSLDNYLSTVFQPKVDQFELLKTKYEADRLELRNDIDAKLAVFQRNVVEYIKNEDVTEDLSKQVDLLNNRLSKQEALTDLLPSRKSVEEALNELDKKIQAILVSQSFPTYSTVPHESADPLNIIRNRQNQK